jgi:hypothetical protein
VASKRHLGPKYELRFSHMPEKGLGGVGQDEEFASEQSDGMEMGISHQVSRNASGDLSLGPNSDRSWKKENRGVLDLNRHAFEGRDGDR